MVAQEIRKLAQSTKDAVQDIERNVEEVHSLTGDVADSIQTASKVIQKGIHEANEAFQFVTDLISRIVGNQRYHPSNHSRYDGTIRGSRKAVRANVRHFRRTPKFIGNIQ